MFEEGTRDFLSKSRGKPGEAESDDPSTNKRRSRWEKTGMRRMFEREREAAEGSNGGRVVPAAFIISGLFRHSRSRPLCPCIINLTHLHRHLLLPEYMLSGSLASLVIRPPSPTHRLFLLALPTPRLEHPVLNLPTQLSAKQRRPPARLVYTSARLDLGYPLPPARYSTHPPLHYALTCLICTTPSWTRHILSY